MTITETHSEAMEGSRTTTAGRAGNGGVAARKAVIRWAWRLFRREWRQQILLVVLIAVGVAATVLGSGVGTNTPPSEYAAFGKANHLAEIAGGNPRLATDLAAFRQHFGQTEVIEDQAIATGLIGGADIRAQDPRGPFGQPMLSLVSGHFPTGGSQVALTSKLAEELNLTTGDTWTQDGQSRRVVGIVSDPLNYASQFALVAPGQVTTPSQVTVLFDASDRQMASFHRPAGTQTEVPNPGNGFAPSTVVLVFAIFGLLFIGLVASAGFATMAQRRLRSLGMLSSLGATDRHVRLVMIANGAVVGVLGTLIGGGTGLLAWIAYAPHLAMSAEHQVLWTSLPWAVIAIGAVLAVLTAILAARRPARIMAAIPVVSALSGRPAQSVQVHRATYPGVALIVLGPALLAGSGGWGANSGSDPLFLLGGLIATAVGLLLLAPLSLVVVGKIAKFAPFTPRLALRDLARHRARSGAALAATSFAVLIAMLVALIAGGRYSNAMDYFAPNLQSNQMVIDLSPTGGQFVGLPGTSPPPPMTAAEIRATVGSISSAIGATHVLPLEQASVDLTASEGSAGSDAGNVYVATPALLAFYGIAASDIRPGVLLITARPTLPSTPNLALSYGPQGGGGKAPPMSGQNGCGDNCILNPSVQELGQLPADSSAPNLLVTPYAVGQLHLASQTIAYLLQAPKALTPLQISAARQLAAATSLTLETKNGNPSLAELRNYATIAGILLALGILAMTVGLIRNETVADMRTLETTGASRLTRRAIAASTAGCVGLLGGILGTAVAYVATVAFFRSQLQLVFAETPTLDLLLVILGLPLAAALGGGLFAGRAPAAIRTPAID